MKMKRYTFYLFTACDSSIIGAHAVKSESSMFPFSGRKRYFSYSYLSVTLCNGASICEYRVISRCDTHENTFEVILSFEAALVHLPML